jgi:hypothetical protein
LINKEDVDKIEAKVSSKEETHNTDIEIRTKLNQGIMNFFEEQHSPNHLLQSQPPQQLAPAPEAQEKGDTSIEVRLKRTRQDMKKGLSNLFKKQTTAHDEIKEKAKLHIDSAVKGLHGFFKAKIEEKKAVEPKPTEEKKSELGVNIATGLHSFLKKVQLKKEEFHEKIQQV